MPLAEARARANAHFEQHELLVDREALLQLAAWCEQFSPTVGVGGPDCLCLDITGLDRLFGSEELLAQQIARAFHRRGLAIRLAVADTLGAAWGLAHFGDAPIVVPPGELAIEALPVAALRLDDEVEILSELGIHRIGELLSIPRDALASRFDPQVLRRLDQATGLVPEVIMSHRPPPTIAVESRLEYPLTDWQTVEQILSELLQRVAKTLCERQQGALQIVCELRCEEMPVRLLVGLFRASADPKHLLELAQMQLERTSLPGPMTDVKVAVLHVAPLLPWQQELFEASQREERRQVGLLVDRLSNRLGREAVVRAVPQPDAQPELAFRYEPLTGTFPRKSKHSWRSLPRPLRLEPEPVPLEVLAIVPDGPPIQFQWPGTHRVVHFWGPERIQTGWWRGRYVQRDYYRVQTAEDKRFWLFRRLVDGQWFLHGVFD